MDLMAGLKTMLDQPGAIDARPIAEALMRFVEETQKQVADMRREAQTLARVHGGLMTRVGPNGTTLMVMNDDQTGDALQGTILPNPHVHGIEAHEHLVDNPSHTHGTTEESHTHGDAHTHKYTVAYETYGEFTTFGQSYELTLPQTTNLTVSGTVTAVTVGPYGGTTTEGTALTIV